ncbi:DNA-3-methyladenine glycosylase I [Vibrio agarivorans]|uniref:DNA-3-methyladenine glycosylase I n=1 Tax=Vibrio agarivorans TaxID=153622 RepID=UPI002231F126|nr:DNA-3-methyladenine glycosylase I [Vibrio agarivorans]MDN3663122.1 DNA-3-methyladenine glycosylase I [Vibrio agarivorans]
MKRCHWLDESKPDYVEYHDKEWGVPVYDDRVFFEFLILESAQAGLSWYTILRRREGYRNAFANFDPQIVSTYDSDKVDALVQDEGIIRHRAKIESAINNAQRFLEVQKEFGSFSRYVWGFVDNQVVDVRAKDDYPPATTPLSDALSKDLKKRGFKFVGSTTMYAFLQATGIVNDHDVDCVCRNR